MTYKEFVYFYHQHGYCINDVSKKKRKNKLNSIQLKSKYEKLTKSQDKTKRRNERLRKNNLDRKKKLSLCVDQQWIDICKLVDKRDRDKCRLIECLDYDEFQELKRNAGPFLKIRDHAHVFRRSQYPKHIYNIDNIMTLNRYSHSMLDQRKHPLNGKPIKEKEIIYWWGRIVGFREYNKLVNTISSKTRPQDERETVF